MPSSKRKEVDEILVRHLACGATEDSAARTAGVHVRTVQRRLGQPAFQERLRAYKADLPRRRDAMLDAGAVESIKTLLTLQKEPHPPPVRFRAAQCLLTNSLQQSNRAVREAQVGEAADAEAEDRAAEEFEEKRREFLIEVRETLAPFPGANQALAELMRAHLETQEGCDEATN